METTSMAQPDALPPMTVRNVLPKPKDKLTKIRLGKTSDRIWGI
jgi:hypothetical protein